MFQWVMVYSIGLLRVILTLILYLVVEHFMCHTEHLLTIRMIANGVTFLEILLKWPIKYLPHPSSWTRVLLH